MSQMNLNTTFSMNLSLKSIDEYKNFLEKKKNSLSEKAESIVKQVSEIGLENNYKSAEMLPIENDGSVISGGIRITDEIDTYREFGTGIVGSNNPHVAEFLAKVGWKYDVNEHGENGWIYPKENGGYGWTKGLPAEKKFYEAMINMEELLPIIAKEEFSK